MEKFNFSKFLFNPLAANDEYTRSVNLTFFMVLDPRTTPRSSATNTPGSGRISTIKCTKFKKANFIKNAWHLKG